MSIDNLSSAPDQAGLRSEHDAHMDLHLSLPSGFAHESTEWLAAGPAALATESVQSSDGDDDESSTGATIISVLPLLLIVVAVYFLLLRPRQRQMRHQRELQSNLEVGDEVMLTSGVYGFITGFESGSDVVWVEIDDDVQIRVSRAAVSGKVDTGGAAAATSDAGDSASEPASPTSRRPTLKGGGSRTSAGAAPAPAPKPVTGDAATDEPADE
jgi:preprotein translocase subunit YajC